MMLAAALGFLASAGLVTPSHAETGQVAVVFTKGGFIVGVGGGQGVLIFRGKKYPFTVSGMSVGFTIGASTSKFVGQGAELRSPGDLAGSYARGRGGRRARSGRRRRAIAERQRRDPAAQRPRVGAEVSAAVGGVTITMQ